jgi:hypothetical protein
LSDSTDYISHPLNPNNHTLTHGTYVSSPSSPHLILPLHFSLLPLLSTLILLTRYPSDACPYLSSFPSAFLYVEPRAEEERLWPGFARPGPRRRRHRRGVGGAEGPRRSPHFGLATPTSVAASTTPSPPSLSSPSSWTMSLILFGAPTGG